MLSEKFRISCSQIGKIMTEPKGKSRREKIVDIEQLISDSNDKFNALRDGLKSKDNLAIKINKLCDERDLLYLSPNVPELSETAKSYCQDWVKQKLYERRKSFTSKYTDKGNFVESQAIEYLESALGWDFAVKNDRREYSELIEGECDVILFETIVDLKCCWDCFTFPLFDKVIPEKDYEYQIQGYMFLYGKPKGEVIFCLMDTPEEVIQKEVRWKLGEEYTREQYEAFYATYIYSGLPDDLRIKRFQFEYNLDMIRAIESRVLECREYIASLGY